MRVQLWPADHDPCAEYRLKMPGRAVADSTDLEVVEAGEDPVWPIWSGGQGEWSKGNAPQPPPSAHIVGIQKVPDADVVVMQRPARRHWSELIPHLRAAGIRVVVDMDDDFDNISPDNVAHRLYQPKLSPLRNRLWIHEACKLADLVTVTTPALARRYGYGHCRVLPNMVPESYLKVEADQSMVVGWPGSRGTHPNDLQVTGGAIQRALDANPMWGFHVIGTGAGVAQALGLTEEPTNTGRVWVPFAAYPAKLAELAVGIVPLEESPFNDAKCLDAATRIATRRGILPLSAVEVGDDVWRDGRWRKVEATAAQPRRAGLLLTTSGGRQLRLTTEHRLWVEGRWMKASEMQVGQTLATCPEEVGSTGLVTAPWPSDGRASRGDHDRYAFLDAQDAPRVTITERWGRFLGVFAGDGSVGRQGRYLPTAVGISCDGQDADLIELVMDDFRQMGLWPSTQVVTTWGGQVLRRRSVRASSTHFLRFLTSLGVVDEEHRRRRVCVPEVIWRSPRPVIQAFLAGLFEADGTVGPSVSMTTKHHEFALDIQRLLTALGIEATVRSSQARAGPEYPWRTYWNVSLRRAAVDLFAKDVGFLSARKQARLAAIIAKPHSNAYRPMRWEESIVARESCDLDPVDIQVEGASFAASGFVSHNSSLKLLELSACGVPTVASPTPDNVRLHKMGIGALAKRPADWLKQVRALMQSPLYSDELAGRSREAVSTQTYERHADLWASAWSGK